MIHGKTTRGTTMVEVIVAFTVLILIMGIFSQSMSMAGRMLNKSEDTLMNNRELAGQYYLGEAAIQSRERKTFKFIDVDNPDRSFTLDGYLAIYSGTSGTNGISADGKIYAVEGEAEPGS